jgi:hypothetical protein
VGGGSARSRGWCDLPREASLSSISFARGQAGTDADSKTTRTDEALAISAACPSRPKPVTSVAARTAAAWQGATAPRFVWRMPSTASAISSCERRSFLRAVARAPVPRGFVKRRPRVSRHGKGLPGLAARPAGRASRLSRRSRRASSNADSSQSHRGLDAS